MPKNYDSPEYFDDTIVEYLPYFLKATVTKRREIIEKKISKS